MSPHYGWLVRQFRAARKMRLLDLSRLSGLDVSYLSRIETGQRPVPDLDVCNAIHSALELSPLEETNLLRAAADGRRIKSDSLLTMARANGEVFTVHRKDILRFLKALKINPSIPCSEGGSEM